MPDFFIVNGTNQVRLHRVRLKMWGCHQDFLSKRMTVEDVEEGDDICIAIKMLGLNLFPDDPKRYDELIDLERKTRRKNQIDVDK